MGAVQSAMPWSWNGHGHCHGDGHGGNGPHNNFGVPASGTNQGPLAECPPCGGNLDGSPTDYMWMNFPKKQRLNFMIVSTLAVALTIFHFGVSASANNFIRYVNDVSLGVVSSNYKTFTAFGTLNGGSYWGGVAPCIAGVLGIVAVNARKASRAFVIASAIVAGVGIAIGVFAIIVDSAFVSWWAYTAPVTCGSTYVPFRCSPFITHFCIQCAHLCMNCVSPLFVCPVSCPCAGPSKTSRCSKCRTTATWTPRSRCAFPSCLPAPFPSPRFLPLCRGPFPRTHLFLTLSFPCSQAAVNTCITYFTDANGGLTGQANNNDCFCVTTNFSPNGGYTTTGQPLTTGKCLDIKLVSYRPGLCVCVCVMIPTERRLGVAFPVLSLLFTPPLSLSFSFLPLAHIADIGNYGSTNAVATNQNPNGVVKVNQANYNNCDNVLRQVCYS